MRWSQANPGAVLPALNLPWGRAAVLPGAAKRSLVHGMIGATGCLALLAGLLASADMAVPFAIDLAEDYPPHRIADNLYYVGSRTLSTYLVTTSKGHILINSSFERTVPIIQANVERLGFQLSDVEILLASHAHDDHVAGHASLKALTGAQVLVMRGDDQVMAGGGAGQYLYSSRWRASPVDRVLKDGDKVTLGEATLVARLTPGHTRGCTTWTMRVRDGGKSYQAVIIGSPNVNEGYRLVDNPEYPRIAEDFARTFQVLKSLPCDIFLGAHGRYYGMEEKVARLGPGKPNPFIDPAGYQAYVGEREQTFRAKLQQQQEARAKQPPPPPAR
jgi:metallo-beta-lactamase class B